MFQRVWNNRISDNERRIEGYEQYDDERKYLQRVSDDIHSCWVLRKKEDYVDREEKVIATERSFLPNVVAILETSVVEGATEPIPLPFQNFQQSLESPTTCETPRN